MKVGTIRRTHDSIMRYAGPAFETRVPRERSLPTDHSPAALAGTPVQPEYQRDSSSKRSIFSVFLVVREPPRKPGGHPEGWPPGVNYRVDLGSFHISPA